MICMMNLYVDELILNRFGWFVYGVESYFNSISVISWWSVLLEPDKPTYLLQVTKFFYHIITVVYPIRNGHFKMVDCKSSKR